MQTSISVYQQPAGPCPYLEHKSWEVRSFDLHDLPHATEIYGQLQHRGWRRNANSLYQNVCAGCNRCISIRIPVAEFSPSKSQRRTLRANADLQVSVQPLAYQEEFEELYRRYQAARHPKAGQENDPDEEALTFQNFFSRSPVNSEFIVFRQAGKLIGLSLVDVLPDTLSSVYFIYEPNELQRRPGIFSLLQEIEYAKQLGLDWLNLGFWVPGCNRMEYKAELFPQEVLSPGGWLRRNRPSDPLPIQRPWPSIEWSLFGEDSHAPAKTANPAIPWQN